LFVPSFIVPGVLVVVFFGNLILALGDVLQHTLELAVDNLLAESNNHRVLIVHSLLYASRKSVVGASCWNEVFDCLAEDFHQDQRMEAQNHTVVPAVIQVVLCKLGHFCEAIKADEADKNCVDSQVLIFRPAPVKTFRLMFFWTLVLHVSHKTQVTLMLVLAFEEPLY
jgi:hypothetical protein